VVRSAFRAVVCHRFAARLPRLRVLVAARVGEIVHIGLLV
jgi:hypothetical protein